MTHSVAMRFSPPSLELSDLTRWILLRAFAPEAAPAETPAISKDAPTAAAKLGVAARISHRVSPSVLEEELNRQAADALADEQRRCLTAALAYEGVAGTVADHARRLNIPIVFLKGFALHSGQYSPSGSRSIGDLDLLAPEESAQTLHSSLREAGFEPAEAAPNEQHLPPLSAPGWGVVDLHYAVRGVCDANGRWLTVDTLLAEDGSAEVSPGAWVPGPSVLAAHALGHAIEQHGLNPRPYPLLRFVADLLDLLSPTDDWPRAEREVQRLLEPTLGAHEVAGAFDLSRSLASGELPSVGSHAENLLSHCLAHALDSAYRRSLGRRHLVQRMQQAQRRGGLLRYMRRKLVDLGRRL